MSTLAEIEAAADKLPVSEKKALIERLTAQVQQNPSLSHSPSDLSQFSGVLKLDQDPLTRQQRARGEWE
jgi:hypothetical protein